MCVRSGHVKQSQMFDGCLFLCVSISKSSRKRPFFLFSFHGIWLWMLFVVVDGWILLVRKRKKLGRSLLDSIASTQRVHSLHKEIRHIILHYVMYYIIHYSSSDVGVQLTIITLDGVIWNFFLASGISPLWQRKKERRGQKVTEIPVGLFILLNERAKQAHFILLFLLFLLCFHFCLSATYLHVWAPDSIFSMGSLIIFWSVLHTDRYVMLCYAQHWWWFPSFLRRRQKWFLGRSMPCFCFLLFNKEWHRHCHSL